MELPPNWQSTSTLLLSGKDGEERKGEEQRGEKRKNKEEEGRLQTKCWNESEKGEDQNEE